MDLVLTVLLAKAPDTAPHDTDVKAEGKQAYLR